MTFFLSNSIIKREYTILEGAPPSGTEQPAESRILAKSAHYHSKLCLQIMPRYRLIDGIYIVPKEIVMNTHKKRPSSSLGEVSLFRINIPTMSLNSTSRIVKMGRHKTNNRFCVNRPDGYGSGIGIMLWIKRNILQQVVLLLSFLPIVLMRIVV